MTIPPITKAEALVERVKISFMTDTTTPAEEKKQQKQPTLRSHEISL